ncbi:hypothetical protein [Stanieria cyanosphaera]|uniref:hypothetical protein n=1 Tax=Stanieria cyanosphaera TaxID=102116 RepID=UPI001494E550|nr:hypothetical protein [Stanieria cyanosphaera]
MLLSESIPQAFELDSIDYLTADLSHQVLFRQNCHLINHSDKKAAQGMAALFSCN